MQGKKYANTSITLNILGRLHHNKGNYETAADLYTAALEMAPNSSSIFQNLGGAFASQGNTQLAFAAFQRAIDLDPTDRYTYFKLGMMYEQLGEMPMCVFGFHTSCESILHGVGINGLVLSCPCL